MTNDSAFWDSSALLPLICREVRTERARFLGRRYGRMMVWWGTRVEVFGAMARLHREGVLSESAFRQATERLRALSRAWSELGPAESVREQAEEVLARSAIRAADSLQLAAALVWCRGRARNRPFICFDRRLADAARQSGFDVQGEPRA
jgi:predicted nucleic acid-binding protein